MQIFLGHLCEYREIWLNKTNANIVNLVRNTTNNYTNIVDYESIMIFGRQGRSLDRQITTQDIDCLRVGGRSMTMKKIRMTSMNIIMKKAMLR